MYKIVTKEQHLALVARIEELLSLVDNSTSANDKNLIELELLSNVVADYEDEQYPLPPPTLAETIKLRMYELKLTQQDTAKRIGVSASRLSQYLTGKSEPTLKVGRSICINLNIDADIVLGV